MLVKNFDSCPRLTLMVLSGDGRGHTFEQAHSILTACQPDQRMLLTAQNLNRIFVRNILCSHLPYCKRLKWDVIILQLKIRIV